MHALQLLRFFMSLLLFVLILAANPLSVSAQGIPGSESNQCLAGKTKCVSKKIAGLLKCRGKCQKSPSKCGQVQADCETKVMEKFDGGSDPSKGCFAKLEAKQDPAKPASICATTGDTASVEIEVDTVVAELLDTLEATTCSSLGLNDAFCAPFSCHASTALLCAANCATLECTPCCVP